MKGKRKKDPAFYELHEILSDLLEIVEDYHQALEDELSAEEAQEEPYASLVWALNGHVKAVKQLEELLDEKAWPHVIRIGITSSSISHRRAGGFF